MYMDQNLDAPGRPLGVHSPDGSAFLGEIMRWRHSRHLEIITSYEKYDSVNRFEEQSCQNNPDPIWRGRPNKNNNKMSSDMRSVTALKSLWGTCSKRKPS